VVDSKEYWSEIAGPRWVRFQAKLDAQLAPFGNATLDALALATGESVLDVGCGCGATVLEIARRIGASGTVVGIDPSTPMLECARARTSPHAPATVAPATCAPATCAPATFAPATLVEGDAQVYAFDQSFDAVFSRFGWMFFRDSVAALSHLRSVMNSDGRLAFVTWRAGEENGWLTQPTLVAIEPPDPAGPGPFRFADRELIGRVLGEAGWRDVSIAALDRPLVIGGGGSLDEAVDFMLSMGMVAAALESADDAVRSAVRAGVREVFSAHTDAVGGVTFNGAAWLVTARVS